LIQQNIMIMRRRNQLVKNNTGAKVLSGLFIIFFGSVFLAERSGVQVPESLLSWESILVAIGIVMLFRHNFRHFVGYALIGVGVTFIVDDYFPQLIDTNLILPIIVIIFGIAMVLKATNLFDPKKKRSRNEVMFDEDSEITGDDYIETTTLFGGVKKNVTSKNFKGADISTTFGGTEINLTKADIQGPIIINSRTTFGGMTLIVPSNWQVNSEVTAVFGSVEDQRGVPADHQYDPDKVVTLEGSCTFGGVEIQSYA